jgi:hypothetical protein
MTGPMIHGTRTIVELHFDDRYITDTASGFMGRDTDVTVDGLIAEVFGGEGGKIVFCEDCIVEGGDYLVEDETFMDDLALRTRMMPIATKKARTSLTDTPPITVTHAE